LALAGSARDFDVVVVNPASVIGPEDHGRSEFGTLCRRFWRGRIPFHFGGGNNFVDVRDVAAGMLAAAERGRPGERYILGGVNRTHTAFFADMARAAGRLIPRFRLPAAVASFIAWANERMKPASGKRAYLSPAQARLLSLYFFFDTSKARRELGYAPRPWPATLADTHGFWMRGQAA
jgi:dihydroflavonol-4-reductase